MSSGQNMTKASWVYEEFETAYHCNMSSGQNMMKASWVYKEFDAYATGITQFMSRRSRRFRQGGR